MARILAFDIEATNLNANWGNILCVHWKDLESDHVESLRIDQYKGFRKEPWNDKQLVADVKEHLETADLLVGHYSTRFDLPYINTRLITHGLDPIAPIPHVDTWRIARNRMKFNSNRLDTLARSLSCAYEKTELDIGTLQKAMCGHTESLDSINEHCHYDVLVLEEVYKKIRVLAPDHPNINLTRFVSSVEPRCPVCGSSRLQRRGQTVARTRVSPRYHCQACGSWSRGSPLKSDHPNAYA